MKPILQRTEFSVRFTGGRIWDWNSRPVCGDPR